MKPKLLIVEDDEEIQTQMKWALVDTYDVQLAETGNPPLSYSKLTNRPWCF